MKKNILLLPLVCVLAIHCTKKSKDDETSTGSTYQLPKVTGPVSGSAMIQSINKLSTGLSLAEDYPTPTPAPSSLENIFNAANNFVSQGKTGDDLSCVFEQLQKNGVIKFDGTEYLLKNTNSSYQDTSTTKFKVSGTNGSIDTYKMYNCNSQITTGTNILYLGYSKTDSTSNVTFKVMFGSLIQFSTEITGEYTNGAWQSKTADTQYSVLGGLAAANFTLVQGPDYMTINQINTALSSSTKAYSKFSLYGNSSATYQMGAGSSKKCTVSSNTCGSDTTEHWTDSGTTTSTSTMSSDVASGTYLTANAATFNKALTADETWDCSETGLTVIDQASLNSQVASDISTNCQ